MSDKHHMAKSLNTQTWLAPDVKATAARKVGLSANASTGEVMQRLLTTFGAGGRPEAGGVFAQQEALRTERLERMRAQLCERFGLSPDCSDEELQRAIDSLDERGEGAGGVARRSSPWDRSGYEQKTDGVSGAGAASNHSQTFSKEESRQALFAKRTQEILATDPRVRGMNHNAAFAKAQQIAASEQPENRQTWAPQTVIMPKVGGR